jgi:hypothetical protein
MGMGMDLSEMSSTNTVTETRRQSESIKNRGARIPYFGRSAPLALLDKRRPDPHNSSMRKHSRLCNQWSLCGK